MNLDNNTDLPFFLYNSFDFSWRWFCYCAAYCLKAAYAENVFNTNIPVTMVITRFEHWWSLSLALVQQSNEECWLCWFRLSLSLPLFFHTNLIKWTAYSSTQLFSPLSVYWPPVRRLLYHSYFACGKRLPSCEVPTSRTETFGFPRVWIKTPKVMATYSVSSVFFPVVQRIHWNW